MTRILVRFEGGGSIDVRIRLEPTPTTKALLTVVPFSSNVSKWGDEIYFEAPFHSELETDARAEMEIGDIAFWPDGDAIAIFFGRTPASVNEKPMAYSPCNLLGTLEGDISLLHRVKPGSRVEVALAR